MNNFNNYFSVLVFGNGLGTTFTNYYQQNNPPSVINSVNRMNSNYHWNSGKTDKASIFCIFSKPSIISEVQVAVRCGKFIKITAGNGNIADGDPILLLEKTETLVGDNATYNNKCVRSYKVNYKSTLSFIKIELETGGNISLFWVTISSLNEFAINELNGSNNRLNNFNI